MKIKCLNYIVLTVIIFLFSGCVNIEEKYLSLKNDYRSIKNNYKIVDIKDDIHKEDDNNYIMEVNYTNDTDYVNGFAHLVGIANKIKSTQKFKLSRLDSSFSYLEVTSNGTYVYDASTEYKKSFEKVWYMNGHGVVPSRYYKSYIMSQPNIMFALINKSIIKQNDLIELVDLKKEGKLFLKIKGKTTVEGKEYIYTELSSLIKTSTHPLSRKKRNTEILGYALFDIKSFMPYIVRYNVFGKWLDRDNKGMLQKIHIETIKTSKVNNNYNFKTYTGIVDNKDCLNTNKEKFQLQIDGDMIQGNIINGNTKILGHREDNSKKFNLTFIQLNYIPRINYMVFGDMDIKNNSVTGFFTKSGSRCHTQFNLIQE